MIIKTADQLKAAGNISDKVLELKITYASVCVGEKPETLIFTNANINELSRWLNFCLMGRKRIVDWTLTVA